MSGRAECVILRTCKGLGDFPIAVQKLSGVTAFV
jgi:hypothetical protein